MVVVNERESATERPEGRKEAGIRPLPPSLSFAPWMNGHYVRTPRQAAS